MTNPLNIDNETSVSACLKELFKRATHIKFKKKALIYEVGSANQYPVFSDIEVDSNGRERKLPEST